MTIASCVLDSILIANRGEIACRIMRTAKKMGIRVVSVYSDIDADALHVKMADEAYRLEGKSSLDTYLNQAKILDIAVRSQCQAIHPGYGFLSENAEFANAVEGNRLIFVGPSSEAIRNMGIKSTSKEIMIKAEVPVIPGYHGEDQNEEILMEQAERIGYPLMIKAVRGGGGKGMRIVRDSANFLAQLRSAQRESQSAFNDSKVLLEKYIQSPRHIEVQIIGDRYGNYVYLYERDCSVQRRHQKIIEEAPAPGISSEFRSRLGSTGVQVARAVRYHNAGTVEFIMDPSSGEFYFMEMNTRLQVEHPVSEMITGVDLVQWQLMVASGQELPLKQEDLQLRGHSFETRIYAENPYEGFLPGAGNLTHLRPPEHSDTIRIETGVIEGDEVSVHYDPMISKLVVWDENRTLALNKMKQALSQYQIAGLDTNINFLINLCSNDHFIQGDIHTGFIDQHKDELLTRTLPQTEIILQAALSLVLKQIQDAKLEKAKSNGNVFSLLTGFRMNHSHVKTVQIQHLNKEYNVQVTLSAHTYRVSIRGDPSSELCIKNASLTQVSKYGYELVAEGEKGRIRSSVVCLDGSVSVFTKTGSYQFNLPGKSYSLEPEDSALSDPSKVVSPMPGMVDKVLVQPGQAVKTGDPIMVIIAMKMEYVITSGTSGIIEEIFYAAGQSIQKNQNLVKIVPS
ncbi:methylcrotonoyl-CoA carboxylase subunit alpha, mitochondrial isoform X1 [Diaphorina citri]|uniref:Methylcrotonoyl-CoA carboxylase subunit alpha, mitochondrial isoform X1 n=1 Tax=Diaphorina citri TaxID=121845 RepID=A0A3Q0J2H8_DIACI|nr:methylcrotonoyl-CoA carboxylase subunit alpha, mitochondrial isoform X1 [Diaphorina citri]